MKHPAQTMFRSCTAAQRWLGLERLCRRLLVACCLPLIAFSLLPFVNSQDQAPLPDPVPIQRVLLPADRLAAELDKAKRGVLMQLSRADFEDRVKNAVLAGEALKNPPRLVEARYMGRLVDTALEGSAEWKIVNPGTAPGVLAVTPLNLAVRQARWSDNRDLLLGDLQPKEPGLLVEPPGPSSLTLDWSARSVPAGGNIRFSLEVPACALASLELDMPADRAVIVSREACLVSGPHPAAEANRRSWRLSFSGVSQVNFEIRRADPGLPPPLILAPLQSKLELTPGQLQADYDFDLEVMHAPLKEVRCECPAVLRPYEVHIRNLERWELLPGAKGAPGTLVVRLREPIQKGLLQVRCLAPLVSGSVWTAPTLKVLNGLARGETLQLRVHPDVLLDDWQPGGFRTTRAVFQPDGWQVLTLATGIDGGPNPARPGARLQTPGAEFKVRQLAWWQIGTQSSLTAQLTYDVVHGRLFALPLTVPAGWEVEQVELHPPDLLRHWTPIQDKGKTTLLVDLQRALDPAASARLTARLRPLQPFKLPPAGLAVPIPDLAPIGPRLREGALAVSVASLYQAVPNASAAAVPLEIAEERGGDPKNPRPVPAPRPPWGQQTVDYFFPYQGQPVTGTMQLRARPVQLRARCTSDVVIASGRAIQVMRLELAPEVGTPQTIDLFISDPAAQDWDWKTVRGGNPVAEVEPYRAAELAPSLAVLAARTPLQTLGPLLAARRGRWQRLKFTQPLREPVTVETTIELTDSGLGPDPALRLAVLGSPQPLEALLLAAVCQQLAEQGGRQRVWEVPLVTVPAAHRLDGQVTLLLAGADLVQVTGEGLLEVVDVGKADKSRSQPGAAASLPVASTWRTFRYGHPPVSLRLRGGLPSADRSAETAADQVRLSTTLAADGRLVHHFRFQVWNWRQQQLPIRLPVGVKLQAVRSDGRWLGQLPAGETHEGLTVFELPAAGGAAQHEFELIYSTEQPAWSLWTTLHAPVPVLPVRTVSFRRTWRLPAGVAPLVESSLTRLPGGAEERAGTSVEERFSWFSNGGDWLAKQEQDVADAVAALRRQHKAGDDWPLGRVLERFDIEQLKNYSLIVDAQALQAAGLGPNSLLGEEAWDRTPRAGATALAPPWAILGLVCVPCRSAPLLTTREQLAAWQSGPGTLPSRSVEEAVGEALRFGHDRSGRFRGVADWSQQTERSSADGLSPARAAILGPLGNDESEWELLAGADLSPSLTVVHRQTAPTAGLALAGIAALFALWRPPQNERRRRRLLLIWLALAGVALLWLPAALRPLAWPCALTGLGIAVLWEWRPVRTSHALGVPRTAPAALLVLCVVAALPGQVVAPAASTVYLVSDASGDVNKQQVLAPPALLDQLQTLARRGPAGLRGAVLLRADYEGQAEPNAVVFKAQFQVWCFGDELTTLTVPLSSVQLTEAQADGAPAFPTVVKQPREGYRFRVKGRGLHTIVLYFSVPQPAGGEERDVRFSIPELPRSRLVLRVPAPVGYLHAVEARGSQRLSGDAAQQQLEADLGAVNLLRVRWRKDEPKPGQAAVSVQESYYWDLQAAGARLLAVLQYTIHKGWDKNFTIDVPQELEVLSVEAGPLPGGPPAPRLKEWQLRPLEEFKRLRLEFNSPVTQSVQVTLELAPRQPFGKTATLPLPMPREVRPTQGFLAYRTAGLDAQMTQHNAIIGIDDRPGLMSAFAEQFSQPWRFARQEDLEMPTRAFWRAKGGFLHLALKPPPAPTTCIQEVSWRIEPRQGVLRAVARAKSADASLSLVEWKVPDALQIIEVVGANVHHWTRAGGRLQVWLQKPAFEANLQLTGWLPRTPKEQQQFNVPPIHLLEMQKQTTTVRVAIGEGVTVTPGKLQNLLHLPEASTPGREWTYLAEQNNYGGVFATAAAAASADFRLLTFAEVQDRELRFVATLDCTVKSGELRNLTIGVRNWDGGELYLNSPDVARRLEQRQGALGRSWVLELKPGVNRRYQLTLTGKLPLGSMPAVFLPDVRVETSGTAPSRLQRWLAVAGAELAAEDMAELSTAPDPAAQLQQSWPGEAERLRKAGGQVWRVTADDWRLRLRLRSAPARTGTVKVFSSDHASAVVDGQRWQHQAVYWLWHEAGSDLSLRLPPGAALLGVAIDGASVPPLQPGTDRLWLPLSGGAGIRNVQLSWNYPPGKEDFEQPVLLGPKLEGVTAGPATWTVALPAGYQSGRRWSGGKGQSEQVRAASAAGLELDRADAQLRLLNWLVDRARETGDFSGAAQTLAGQDRFERLCRRADFQLGMPAAASDAGPRGQPLASWLQELREQDAELTKTQTYDSFRAEARAPVAPSLPATGMPWLVAPLEQGRPLYWRATGEAAPLFRLIPDDASRNRQATSLSVLLVILLFASWILARSFKTAAWPEQLALQGVLGLLFFGSGWALAFLLLPGIWLGYRVRQLVRWLQAKIPLRVAPDPSTHSTLTGLPP